MRFLARIPVKFAPRELDAELYEQAEAEADAGTLGWLAWLAGLAVG